MPDATQYRIARRLKAFREKRGLTQRTLAHQMGFNHRQTLASIEAGERIVTPEELARAAAVLAVELDAFTDPYRLVGEARFSFRATQVPPETLNAFQRHAAQWVATYRTLLRKAGTPRSHLTRKLEITTASTFEEAHAAAEEIRKEWKLGSVPADLLPDAIDQKLGVKVLFVDAPDGVSGAAIHLPGFHTILVNRSEPPGRRHFDLAHELFHLLTWDAMTPARVEPVQTQPRKGNRMERLAENFAGALLMPADVVTDLWQRRGDADLYEWLNETATSLRVTAVALKWRLKVLALLTKREVEALDDRRLAANGGRCGERSPLPFNREFVTRVYEAVEAGNLSLRKAVRLLHQSLSEFAELCRAYGLDLTYEI